MERMTDGIQIDGDIRRRLYLDERVHKMLEAVERQGIRPKPHHRILGRLFMLEWILDLNLKVLPVEDMDFVVRWFKFTKDELAYRFLNREGPEVREIIRRLLYDRSRCQADDGWWEKQLGCKLNTIQQWRGRYFYKPCRISLRPEGNYSDRDHSND